MTERLSAHETSMAGAVERRCLPHVHRVRSRQDDSGAISEPTTEDVAEVTRLRAAVTEALDEAGSAEQADAFREDTESWLGAGLDSAPDFTRTRDALRPPADGETRLFAGPVLMTNGPEPVGHRMECFLFRRQEPPQLASLTRRYPHPKNNSQCVRLIIGSAGIAQGNCIVFFPENVRAAQKLPGQGFAVFFLSKFRKIHEKLAIPPAKLVFTEDSFTGASDGMDPLSCYNARSLWSYLHDYFHHQGTRPFDQNMKVKMNWFVGLLEELKCDLKTILACSGDGDLPYARAQIEMILLERLVRYPLGPAPERAFDSGTGVLLFSWLLEHAAIRPAGDLFRLDFERTLTSVEALVHEIETLERIEADEEYRRAAKEFVRRYLAEGASGDRYAFSGDQHALLRGRTLSSSTSTLSFDFAEM